MEALTDAAAESSVCFACARRSPRVHGTNASPIQTYPCLVRRSGFTPQDVVTFLGLSCSQTEDMFCLENVCRCYGRMSDEVHLLPSHE